MLAEIVAKFSNLKRILFFDPLEESNPMRRCDLKAISWDDLSSVTNFRSKRDTPRAGKTPIYKSRHSVLESPGCSFSPPTIISAPFSAGIMSKSLSLDTASSVHPII